jgi:hypothetical protein
VLQGLDAVGDREGQIAGVDQRVAQGSPRILVVLHHQDVIFVPGLHVEVELRRSARG